MIVDKLNLRRLVIAEINEHDRLMAMGCIHCRSAVPGRVCPDCHTCVACPSSCAECRPLLPTSV